MTYTSLEEIQSRKDELKNELQGQSGQISTLWHHLMAPQPAASKGELVAHLVSNSITAIDVFADCMEASSLYTLPNGCPCLIYCTVTSPTQLPPTPSLFKKLI